MASVGKTAAWGRDATLGRLFKQKPSQLTAPERAEE
jgi:hypothetical protein